MRMLFRKANEHLNAATIAHRKLVEVDGTVGSESLITELLPPRSAGTLVGVSDKIHAYLRDFRSATAVENGVVIIVKAVTVPAVGISPNPGGPEVAVLLPLFGARLVEG